MNKLILASILSFGFATTVAAEVNVEYEVIARSGTTRIPEGAGNFTGFGNVPAIDDIGNITFTGAGINQSGVYSVIGTSYAKVADKTTLIPGGMGAQFTLFSGGERNDIDNGRVVFTAQISNAEILSGVYTNAGQDIPRTLVELMRIDNVEWFDAGDPYIDGNLISIRVQSPVDTKIMLWNTTDSSTSFVEPGTGYVVSPSTQASISGDAVMFRRYKTNFSEMGVSTNGIYETVATLNITPVPGLPGSLFKYFRDFPAIDKRGIAFIGSDGITQGVFKRIKSGVIGPGIPPEGTLESVSNTLTVIPGTIPLPGWGDQLFNLFPEFGLSLANGEVAFIGNGPNSLKGIYTDIGGTLFVLVDNADNNTIIPGEQITDLGFGPKSFSYTPDGYMAVFKVWFTSGETALVKAVITLSEDPGTSPAESPVAIINYSPDPAVILKGKSVQVTLDGTSSKGSITSWSWEDKKGKKVSKSSTHKVNLKAGMHTYTLTVKDNQDNTSTETLTILALKK